MFKPSPKGSAIFILFLISAYFAIDPAANTTENAGLISRLVGVGLVISIYFDAKKGLRNLFRADLMCIASLYFLTLFEFLFPQPQLNQKISTNQAVLGLEIIVIGMVFLIIGRHIYKGQDYNTNLSSIARDISTPALFKLYFWSFFFAYFYILLKVNFNIFEMLSAATGPRFSQPWSRGRLGDWTAIFSELQLFSYALPPLAGILMNRRKSIKSLSLILVILILLINLFMGFAGGTRNVFLSYIAGFLGGYFITIQHISWKKLLFPIIIGAAITFYASSLMVQFRSVGLSNYVTYLQEDKIEIEEEVYIDHNLYSIGALAELFPEYIDYLGTEVIVWAIIKPIPRFLLPGKPEGLSTGMEDALGVFGYTVASTYLGEAYMGGGILMVIAFSLFFGYMAAWWNGKAAQNFSDSGLLIFALGLFAAGITMRSLFMFTTAILPVIGIQVLMRQMKIHKNKRTPAVY